MALPAASLLSLFQCGYIGVLENSLSRIVNEIVNPLSRFIPPKVVCENLKKVDAQISTLRYGTLTCFTFLFTHTSTGIMPCYIVAENCKIQQLFVSLIISLD